MQHLIFERHERGRVFGLDFTISYLAFLASPILEASKRGTAAAVIQRTFQPTENRQALGQRCKPLR